MCAWFGVGCVVRSFLCSRSGHIGVSSVGGDVGVGGGDDVGGGGSGGVVVIVAIVIISTIAVFGVDVAENTLGVSGVGDAFLVGVDADSSDSLGLSGHTIARTATKNLGVLGADHVIVR